jgi:CheY-like chemotaxis protein
MTTEARPAQPTARVLIVEDEVMIRVLLESMLRKLGYTITAEARRVDEALEVASKVDFDLAILDINLNGQSVSPVADVLSARGTPIVFVTGYGIGGIPEAYRDRPTLKKPFRMNGLRRVLEAGQQGARVVRDTGHGQ